MNPTPDGYDRDTSLEPNDIDLDDPLSNDSDDSLNVNPTLDGSDLDVPLKSNDSDLDEPFTDDSDDPLIVNHSQFDPDDSDQDDPSINDPTPFDPDEDMDDIDLSLFETDESDYESDPDDTTQDSALNDEDSIPKTLLEPLYPGAAISVCAAYCLIMKFAITSKLSYTAIGNLLKLLRLLCPFSNNLPSSFYRLRTFFKQYTPSHEKQRVCPECERVLEVGDHCPRDHGGFGHVVHIPIEKSLRTIVQSKWTSPI